MTDHLIGTCQLPRARSTGADVSLWESRRSREDKDSVGQRHLRARLECWVCPVLEACEAALTDMERQGQHVDGVMAARYSDVKSRDALGIHQAKCRGCHVSLWPQAKDPDQMPSGRLRHVGEGLCETCWPAFSRSAHNNTNQRRTA